MSMYVPKLKLVAALLLLLVTAPTLALAQTNQPARDKDHFFLQPKDVVVWLGDSITAEGRYHGFIYNYDLKSTYPELTAGDGKVTFINAGISGDTANGGLKRVDDVLAKNKPTIVVVCFGMNHRGGDPNFAKTELAIVKKIKEAGVIPVLLTSPPVSTVTHANMKSMVPNLKGFADDVAKIAADESILSADCFTPLLAFEEKTKKDFTWGDGVHPNAEGAYVMGRPMLNIWGFGKPLAGHTEPPQKVIFWQSGNIESGKSWSSPSSGKDGKTGLAVQAKETHTGPKALEWSCSGARGVKGAWNIFEWSPNNAGIDVSAFKTLSLWVKVTGEQKPDALRVYLDCAFSKTLPVNYGLRQTPRLDLLKYCKEAADGQWHQVLIPMTDILDGKTEWDAKTFSEIGLDASAKEPANFSVFVDEILFTDRAKAER